MTTSQTAIPTELVLEYENLEALQPLYVEGAQGTITQKNVLHISFYSQYRKTVKVMTGELTKNADDNSIGFQLSPKDPYGPSSDGKVYIVRRIEASLILDRETLKETIPWLQKKLREMEEIASIGD